MVKYNPTARSRSSRPDIRKSFRSASKKTSAAPKVYAAIDMYMRELWDMERTLQALAFYERNDQYRFLTPRSIAALRYVETYEVKQ